MGPAPLPVVSSQDPFDDDDECPVCLEPLSFSFKLPGEKPHIIPECGHSLHEAGYPALYFLAQVNRVSDRLALLLCMAHLQGKLSQCPGNLIWVFVVSVGDQ